MSRIMTGIIAPKRVARLLLLFALQSAPIAWSQSDKQWVLEQSTLSYHMSHPMHQVDGVSHGAKGKGSCHAGECDFLIAAPVNSFDSGDSNRDLHMIQVTRGAQFPLVVVRTHIAEQQVSQSSVLYADLEVQFAGQTAKFSHLPFQVSRNGSEVKITGTIPATCSEFKIDPPSFLTIPIKNEIPVRVDMNWRAAP